jgi:DNA-binding MarR family transcriptional regulator
MTADKRLFFKMNLAQRLLLKHFDKEMAEKTGVPITQVAALFFLDRNDGCLLKDLSEALYQNKSAITTLVERMEKNGLVLKKASETDGRAAHIFMTDKGRSVCAEAIPLVKANNEKLSSQFTEDEIETVHRVLDRIIEMFG